MERWEFILVLGDIIYLKEERERKRKERDRELVNFEFWCLFIFSVFSSILVG